MRYFILLPALALSACSLFRTGTHPTPLTKRYDRIDASVELSGEKRVVDVFTQVMPSSILDSSKDKSKTIFDLQGNGQRALIETYGKKDDDGQKRIAGVLNATFQEKKAPPKYTLSKDYTLVFSTVLRDFYSQITKSLSEGDRIAKLRFKVTISKNDSDITFLKWDKYVTQFAQFNIGGVTFNNVKNATLSPSFGLFGAAATSLGSVSNANTYQENDSLQLRYVALNGILTKDSLELDQSGTPQIDLQGNTTVNVTVNFDEVTGIVYFSFDGLTNDKGVYAKQEDVDVKRRVTYFPQVDNDITLHLSVDYVLRHIESGDKTFTEGDDAICYYWGNFQKDIPGFIKAADLRPQSWDLLNRNTPIILFNPATGEHYPLAFASFDDGNSFLAWINHTLAAGKITIGKYDHLIGYNDDPAKRVNVNKATADSLWVKINH